MAKKDLFTPLNEEKQATTEALPANEPQEIAPQQSQMPAKPMEAIPGLEEFDTDDLIIPRISLAQGLSDAVVNGKVGMGDIYNNTTEEIIGKMKDKKASIKIIPIMYTKSRVCYAPRNDGDIAAIKLRYPDADEKQFENRNMMICGAQDSRNATGDFGLGSKYNPSGLCVSCKLKDWEGDSAPPCTFFRNLFVLVDGYDFDLPLVVSFGKTSAKTGKKLINIINMMCRSKRLPIWNFTFELSTKFVDDGSNKYYVWDVRPAGRTEDEATKEMAAMFYEMLQSARFKIQDEKESSVPIPEDDVTPNEEAAF